MATSNAGSSAEELISTEKMVITVRSNDNELFEVERNIFTQSVFLKNLAEDCEDGILHLKKLRGAVLRKVIDYSKRHGEAMEKKEAAATALEKRLIDDDLKKFDQEFVKLDENMLFELMLAADYLFHDGLIDLTCQAVADVLETKPPEEVRKIFGIVNDYTPEEEEAIRNENKWAFE